MCSVIYIYICDCPIKYAGADIWTKTSQQFHVLLGQVPFETQHVLQVVFLMCRGQCGLQQFGLSPFGGGEGPRRRRREGKDEEEEEEVAEKF